MEMHSSDVFEAASGFGYDRYKKCYRWVLVNKAERVVIFFYEDGSRGHEV